MGSGAPVLSPPPAGEAPDSPATCSVLANGYRPYPPPPGKRAGSRAHRGGRSARRLCRIALYWGPRAAKLSFHIERVDSLRLARGIEGDFLDPRLGLPQQVLTAPLENLAALVDGDRLLQWHLAVFEALDDRL
jgi:hypothetical protein